MKKSHLIILIGQALIIVLLLTYSIVQRAEAQEAQQEALAQKSIAEKSMEASMRAQREAEEQRRMADINAIEAQRQAELARRQAEKCK